MNDKFDVTLHSKWIYSGSIAPSFETLLYAAPTSYIPRTLSAIATLRRKIGGR